MALQPLELPQPVSAQCFPVGVTPRLERGADRAVHALHRNHGVALSFMGSWLARRGRRRTGAVTLHACFVDVTIPQVAEMCVLGEGRLAGKGDTRHVVVEGDDTAVQRGSHQQIGLRDERADPKDVHVGVHPDRHLLQAAAGHLWVLEVDEWATLAQADGGFRAPSHALNSQGPPPESVEQPSTPADRPEEAELPIGFAS